MKKTVKSIVIASLLSSQFLGTPIAVIAATEETPLESQVVETKTEEVTKPIATMDSEKRIESNPEVRTEMNVATTPELPPEKLPEIKSEAIPEVTTKETPENVAPVKEETVSKTEAVLDTATIDAVKKSLKDKKEEAEDHLSGTFHENPGPVEAAITVAETLLAKPDATLTELNVALVDLTNKLDTLISEEKELTFLVNLLDAIEAGESVLGPKTEIEEKKTEFEDFFTTASVEAKRTVIENEVTAGKNLLSSLIDPSTNELLPSVAISNEPAITAQANKIFAALNDNLVSRAGMEQILEEASFLEGAIVPDSHAGDKVALENAVAAVVDAWDNAVTEAEANAAIAKLRAAMDNLHLMVQVTYVTEDGTPLFNPENPKMDQIIGLYKEAFTITPPEMDGYEYVGIDVSKSAFKATQYGEPALSGTFGNGQNFVQLTYRGLANPPYPYPIPDPMPAPLPAPIITRNPVLLQTINNSSRKPTVTLPQTNEQEKPYAQAIGLITLGSMILGTVYASRKKEDSEEV